MARGRYVKEPGATKGRYLPCPKCLKARCECLELLFVRKIAEAGLPAPDQREYRFTQVRGWRADFAYTKERILIEVEGGGSIGRHSSVAGFREDCVKYNTMATLGWRVLRFDKRLIDIGVAALTVEAALRGGSYVPPTVGQQKRLKNGKQNASIFVSENRRNAHNDSEKAAEKAHKKAQKSPAKIRKQTQPEIDPVSAVIEAAKNTPVFRGNEPKRISKGGRRWP
jgi:hypothetical protein